MASDPTFSVEEMEKRRKAASARRKSSAVVQPHFEGDSEAMAVIHEIFNPSLKLPESKGPYKLPDEMNADDIVAMKDLDIKKLAELKEVFLLFDIDSDGLISKNDLRFTFIALGAEVPEEQLEEMLKEAKDPLDYEAFVELMCHHTLELDPEDVLLEAWSKWDDFGSGKIEEKKIYEELTNYGDRMSTSEANEALKHAPLAKPKSLEEPPMIDYPAFCQMLSGLRKPKGAPTQYCSDYVEIFPHLREPAIENSTRPEQVICNRTTVSNIGSNANISSVATVTDFAYSEARVFGIRVHFKSPRAATEMDAWSLNITGEYRFLKKDKFRNDGRLIPGSYCDYYFFGDDDTIVPQTSDKWMYFHSPRFPAKYPAHIKCTYKFIGRPGSHVEIIFEELNIPKQESSCNLDKLTIFDAESTKTSAIIDVLCETIPTRHIFSSGPDLLIEFDTSSNITGKGFRGKFRFLKTDLKATTTTEPAVIQENEITKMLELKANTSDVLGKYSKELPQTVNTKNCGQTFDSRSNKSGIFENPKPAYAKSSINSINSWKFTARNVNCRYEFLAEPDERVQIKFLDFNIPSKSNNTVDCKPNDSLQLLLLQASGKYVPVEFYCGSYIPRPIISNGPNLLLQFIGKLPAIGTKTSYYGFRAEYKFLTNFGISSGHQLGNNCTFTYNSTLKKTDFFSSPNFPGLYPRNIVCHYLFYGTPEEKVTIQFTYFDVEGISTCEYLTASDYVEFSNFMSTDRKFMKYCGKLDPFKMRSDGRFFRLTFYSNDRFENMGFRALYTFEAPHTPAENASMQSYISVKEGNTANWLHTHWMAALFCVWLIFV